MARGGKREGAGRKPGVSRATELKRKIQEYSSEEEVQQLVSDVKTQAKKHPELLKFLIEQLFGKAPQRLEVTGEGGKPLVVEISREIATKHGLNSRPGSDSG